MKGVMAPAFSSSNNRLSPAREAGALWGFDGKGRVKKLKG
jgi:hypothetical protein